MTIAYIQPIFAPDERIFNKNLRSIRSMKQYCEHFSGPDRFVFGGWGNGSYAERLASEIRLLFPDSVCDLYERNFGKAYIVNDLYDKYLKDDPDVRYMLLSDSDIVYSLDVPNLIERHIAAGEAFAASRGKAFGLLAPNQLEGNCHALEKVLANRFTVELDGRSESIAFPDTPSGIAGSCWLTSRAAWDTARGYRTMGVYAGEDAYYLIDVDAHGFSYGMCDSAPVIHPIDDDPLYNLWKHETCVRDTTGHVIGNLEEKVSEADDFWAKRQA